MDQQDKPIEVSEADDSSRGLYGKYIVKHADGRDLDGECFVLRPDRDPAAVVALRAYAQATNNKQLASDIRRWIGDDPDN